MSGIISDNVGRSTGLIKAVTSTETIKAWVNFNGTGTAAIRASGNVSSLTDHGTGLFTVTFTVAMADTNYGAAFMQWYSLSDGGGGNNHMVEGSRVTSSMAVGSVRVFTEYSGGSAQDHTVTSFCVYR